MSEDIYKKWNERWGRIGSDLTIAGKLITKAKQNAMKRMLEGRSIRTVIDVGCGAGYCLETLKDLGFNVKGIDASLNAVNICRSKGLPAFQSRLEDEKEKYDLVFSDGLIEHFPDMQPFIKKMVEISNRYVMIAQTDHDAFIVKFLHFLEKILRPDNIEELDYKINDFIQSFEEYGCVLNDTESVFFNGFKVLFFDVRK